jgi:tRNA uridine 5-carboxymethylaminomethyl modification enzyme
MMKNFDILIVGGGHAGVEAAFFASRFKNLRVGILTMPGVGLASAPCNPSIGGVGKGQVVREIDALGGLMPRLADLSGIQFRTLNESKGYAVQSTRVQIDKDLYSKFATDEINKIENITLVYDKVSDVVFDKGKYIITATNGVYTSDKLIMTVGTFLNGKIHRGEVQVEGGRDNCTSSASMDSIFKNIKTLTQRFKTGTPPRLKYNSIDFTQLEEQPSDGSVRNFHYENNPFDRNLDQVSCFLARTNEVTMKHIRDNLDKSPMYNGQINAIGARYCPSIEDKAARYPDKDIHHVFVEPETMKKDTVYPSGISSSLPVDVQDKIIRSIKGLEDSEVTVYGYAVEYDVVDTTQLNLTLEHKSFPGLYFAGQVNGTSGYEEAAGQGLVAGINAALKLKGSDDFILSRKDSYIGVMIEDLVSNTRDEPYRLFTARSENRLYIREDNAILRLAKNRKQLGLNEHIDYYNEQFVSLFNDFTQIINETYISPNDDFLKEFNIKIPRRISLSELLKQASLDPVKTLKQYLGYVRLVMDEALINCIAISNKYSGYIRKSEESSQRMNKIESKKINWKDLLESENISFECKRRIEKIQPQTFGQLKRIEGIRPATLAAVAGSNL